MVAAYGIAYPPALRSKHVDGLAIDMSISWAGSINVARLTGGATTIDTSPHNGFNLKLRQVGLSYGVVKNATDPPHWSDNGR